METLELEPIRVRFDSEDIFLVSGNILRNSTYVVRDTETEDAEICSADVVAANFDCSVVGCQRTFRSLPEYENHFKTAHMHQCSICSRCFISERLLSIHISERHDSFFAVMSLKKPSYLCLVEGCPVVCASYSMRKLHLQEVHRYPKEYDFNSRGQTVTCRPADTLTLKEKRKLRRQKGVAPEEEENQATSEVFCELDELAQSLCSIEHETEPHQIVSVPRSTATDSTRKRRNQPCRHFQRGHCRLGTTCLFLHSKRESGTDRESAVETTAKADESMDDESVQPESAPRVKTVFVPRNLAFGRHQKGGLTWEDT